MGEQLGEAVAALAEASRWIGGAPAEEPGGRHGRRHARTFACSAWPPAAFISRAGALAAAAQRRTGGADRDRPLLCGEHRQRRPGLKETVIGGAESTLMLSPEALSA